MIRRVATLLPATLPIASAARAETPLTYMRGFGARTYDVTSLTWGLLAISVAVVLIVTALLLAAIFRGRKLPADLPAIGLPVGKSGGGLSWLYIGVGISTVVLLASTVWTVVVLARVAQPPSAPAVTIEVTGHQWWWEARYLSDRPDQIFTTANEIHIPTGAPVRIQLIGGDVIHSFWVPALGGKTDTIPGQTNLSWIEADKPGAYRIQCTEFCGLQHAYMAGSVIAESPADFAAWQADQRRDAAPPTAQLTAGMTVVETRCGGCHTVRGTTAGGIVGPDLTHVMSRRTLAAGTIPNSPEELDAWVQGAQDIKPGTQMPDIALNGPDAQNLHDYLMTLK